MGIKHITAPELLEAEAKAMRNAADKPTFKHLQKELELLPEVQERLAFELLAMAIQSLRHGTDPGKLTFLATYFSRSIRKERIPEYLTNIEEVIALCFKHLEGRGDGCFTFTLKTMLAHLRLMDYNRFRLTLEKLNESCGQSQSADNCRKLLAEIDEPKSKKRMKLQEIKRRVALKQIENERLAQANRN